MLSFFLTTKCNLRCIYCYNCKEREAYEHQTISLDFAKLGIDYFSENFQSKHIRFYGPGEPTQEFSLMKEITEYASEKLGNGLSIEIQTNGVFNKAVREWLLNNVNIIWISFDGPPDIQDVNRPLNKTGKGSSFYIEKNVKFLIENKKIENQVIGARVTIVNKSIAKQKVMIDYFQSLGITYIWSDPLFPTVGTEPVNQINSMPDNEVFDLIQYVDEFLIAQKYALRKGIFYGSFLSCNFDGKSNLHCRACIPVPHLTPDGYISACDMVTFGEKPNHMSPFIYGKWNKQANSLEFFDEKIKILQSRTVENMLGCKNCSVKENCGGYCLGEVLNETGSLFGKKEHVCKAVIELSKKMKMNFGEYKYLHP